MSNRFDGMWGREIKAQAEAKKQAMTNNKPTEVPERIALHPQTLRHMHGHIYKADDSEPGDIIYARVDPPAAPTAKWDKAGLKEACQRALKLGRTHQEMDIQLVLDMLLEIERLEASTSNG